MKLWFDPMISNIFKIIFFFFSVVTFALAVDDDGELEFFPENIVVKYNDKNINLKRTGTTIRKKYFFNIYKIAHYVDSVQTFPPNSKDIYDAILLQNYAKQITTVYLRSIKAEQIKKALMRGFKLNTNDEEYREMLPHINAFMRVINQDVSENDEFVLRWLPDGTIISLFQGKKISSVKNKNFARTLWSIWFGRFSVVKRDTLVKELLTSS